jgi:hypothetical protein
MSGHVARLDWIDGLFAERPHPWRGSVGSASRHLDLARNADADPLPPATQCLDHAR